VIAGEAGGNLPKAFQLDAFSYYICGKLYMWQMKEAAAIVLLGTAPPLSCIRRQTKILLACGMAARYTRKAAADGSLSGKIRFRRQNCGLRLKLRENLKKYAIL